MCLHRISVRSHPSFVPDKLSRSDVLCTSLEDAALHAYSKVLLAPLIPHAVIDVPHFVVTLFVAVLAFMMQISLPQKSVWLAMLHTMRVKIGMKMHALAVSAALARRCVRSKCVLFRV